MYLNFNQKLVSYFLFKLTKNILFCWLLLTLLISLFDLIDLNNKTRLKENISIDSLFLLTIQNLPLRADELLFYSILFGSVFYYLELRKSQEFLILRTNGVSLWRAFFIISIVPLIFGLFSIFILNPIVSFSQKIYNINYETIFGKGKYSISISNQGLWLRDRSNLGEIIINGTFLDTERARIQKPVFFLVNSDTQYTKRINADWAYLDNYVWRLENPMVNGEKFNSSTTLNIKSVLNKSDLKYTSNTPYSLSFFEITKFIKVLDSTGLPSLGYKVYFHKIFSQPLSFIGIIALSGAIIFMNFSRLVPVKAVSYTIIGSFLYYFIQRLFIALGTSEQMPIIFATWLPSVILLGLGLFLISFIEE